MNMFFLVCALVMLGIAAIALWKDVRDSRKRNPPAGSGFEVLPASHAGDGEDGKARKG
jgi:hypothetical protein